MPHLVSVRIRDDGGKTASVNVFVPASATLAQIQAWADAMLPALDAVTAGVIDRAGVSLQLTLPGALKATPIADAPINFGANFGFSAANTVYRHTVHVPAIDQGLVDAGVLDVTDPLITAWYAYLVTGDGTVAPTNEYDQDLTGFLAGDISFRKG